MATTNWITRLTNKLTGAQNSPAATQNSAASAEFVAAPTGRNGSADSKATALAPQSLREQDKERRREQRAREEATMPIESKLLQLRELAEAQWSLADHEQAMDLHRTMTAEAARVYDELKTGLHSLDEVHAAVRRWATSGLSHVPVFRGTEAAESILAYAVDHGPVQDHAIHAYIPDLGSPEILDYLERRMIAAADSGERKTANTLKDMIDNVAARSDEQLTAARWNHYPFIDWERRARTDRLKFQQAVREFAVRCGVELPADLLDAETQTDETTVAQDSSDVFGVAPIRAHLTRLHDDAIARRELDRASEVRDTYDQIDANLDTFAWEDSTDAADASVDRTAARRAQVHSSLREYTDNLGIAVPDGLLDVAVTGQASREATTDGGDDDLATMRTELTREHDDALSAHDLERATDIRVTLGQIDEAEAIDRRIHATLHGQADAQRAPAATEQQATDTVPAQESEPSVLAGEQARMSQAQYQAMTHELVVGEDDAVFAGVVMSREEYDKEIADCWVDPTDDHWDQHSEDDVSDTVAWDKARNEKPVENDATQQDEPADAEQLRAAAADTAPEAAGEAAAENPVTGESVADDTACAEPLERAAEAVTQARAALDHAQAAIAQARQQAADAERDTELERWHADDETARRDAARDTHRDTGNGAQTNGYLR
ncbi:hypothetical protein ACFTSF_04510 [Kribbella sp. NPDC056951]|uniref:hypothetical protein n=1 Tax=Kribbella sp. NPDC056951 TaxID=3345978 RepID=UPI0036362D0D